MHRRDFHRLAIGLSIASCPLCTSATAASHRDIVLCSSGSGFDLDTIDRTMGTGTPALDRALGQELNAQSRFFGLRPAFYIYRGSIPNAAATTKVYGETPDTDGTILYQRGLLIEHLSRGHWGGSIVAGVIAHEFAHIAQFNHSSVYDTLRQRHETVKFVELHADYIAGYYMGTKFAANPDDLDTLARAVFRLGDDHFTSVGHHGTPEQRYVALKGGFNYYRRSPQRSVGDAIDAGYDFVNEYFPTFDR